MEITSKAFDFRDFRVKGDGFMLGSHCLSNLRWFQSMFKLDGDLMLLMNMPK